MTREDIYTINQSRESRDIINLSICGVTYPDKNYRIIRKDSTMACIEYIEQGTGTVHIGDECFCPLEGDSYFLQCGKDHDYCSDKDFPWKKYFINVRGSLLENMTESYGLKGVYHYKGLNLKEELCSIISLASDKENDFSDEIIGILNSMFLKMHKFLKNGQQQLTVAEKMKNFLSMHAEEKFRMKDLCAYLSLSESGCTRAFKSAYGITPYAYFIGKKLSLAKSLLINTNLSVKQIAYKLSFADEYYFSNVFKKKEGISPTEFRKNNM